MFFPDKVRGYAEARRVLRAGGTFHFNAWDRVEANPAWCVVGDALNAVSRNVPLLLLRRMPYSYFDPAVIGTHLEQAGLEGAEQLVPGQRTSGAGDQSANDRPARGGDRVKSAYVGVRGPLRADPAT